MQTDLEIARSHQLRPIHQIASHIGIDTDKLIPFGRHIAKLPLDLIDEDRVQKSKLILVTAITPTKAGNGKTTVAIGLAMGLERLGKKTTVALREPSLGVCFGMKGGAAGGGHAQVLPMEDINLHFTGDMHAITAAHNMITALLENYQYVHRNSDLQLQEILWRRVMDVNDRSLRQIVTGLGGNVNGVIAESGFDITPASELMAILCLSTDIQDLKKRIDAILLGYTKDKRPFIVKDLEIGGAITVLLKDAILPNLVQTTERTAAIIHGGPFANIAHGCNSIVATKIAMSHADYVITEAGFGADLGAEKFFNIKCRMAGISPAASVLIVTSQALKYHGGVKRKEISKPNMDAIKAGLQNVEKHVKNLRSAGQTVIVAFNKFHFDVPLEIEYVRKWCDQHDIYFAVDESFLLGGEGAIDLAKTIDRATSKHSSKPLHFSYEDHDTIQEKITKVATSIYGAKDVVFGPKATKMLRRIKKLGMNRLPVCIAKTQYSFTDDASHRGVAQDFSLHIEQLIINSGAGFIVALAGSIIRMPGLPKKPRAHSIDYKDGLVEGLS